jgi:hypothetical protein
MLGAVSTSVAWVTMHRLHGKTSQKIAVLRFHCDYGLENKILVNIHTSFCDHPPYIFTKVAPFVN